MHLLIGLNIEVICRRVCQVKVIVCTCPTKALILAGFSTHLREAKKNVSLERSI